MSNWILSLAAAAARLLPTGVRRGLYRFGPLARAIRQTLNRAAPQGLTTVSVAAGGLSGLRLALDLQDEKDYWLGTYEPELQATVAELVQPGMVVYDVGANIGYISLLLARAVGAGGQVFSFEALPANVERLRANLALNKLPAAVRVVPAAVVECARQVEFLVGPSNGTGKAAGSAGRQNLAYSQTVRVPGISLDEFVYSGGNPPPQVVKMDVEGGEVLALPGMQRLLQEARPLVLLELHGPEAAREVWEGLTAAGYQVCSMQPGYPRVPSLEALDWKAYLVARP